jgi:hypothetical protein
MFESRRNMSNKSAIISLFLRFYQFFSLPLMREVDKEIGMTQIDVSKETANKMKPSSCSISFHSEFVNRISQGRKTNQTQLSRNNLIPLP